MTASSNRITIISPIHGKLTPDGKVSEPDIYYILEKWLDRHPLMKGREKDIRIIRGQWTTEDGLRTEVITVSMDWNQEMAKYNPTEDVDLYEYFVAEERYWHAD